MSARGWENIFHIQKEWAEGMEVTASNFPSESSQSRMNMSVDQIKSLLDTLDRAVILSDRNGQLLTLNDLAKRCLDVLGVDCRLATNIMEQLLEVNPEDLLQRLQDGENEIALRGNYSGKPYQACVRLIRDSEWLLVEVEAQQKDLQTIHAAVQPTVQELLQEREITYRNLLAAYLKLQEVNRQKTVFLASAAHELKTPLAVIKGYYDLLLTGSLGKLTEKQRDILEESKESCERLVRLVSMFLNYSALESGKLVLQLRENDLRDCLEEIASRWSEGYQRKGVKLESQLDPSIPTFKFDYQKVQQVTFNLLDNALKHTPAGGTVTLRARPHFWERRVAQVAPTEERRRFRLPRPNSVEVSVSDSGAGIAPEHHQEIFEDFMRVDKNTSGMGLGLAIAKRLIQAHRGKIWVESETQRGSTFAFLLPMDQS
jgi:signal transduction histidine kinase